MAGRGTRGHTYTHTHTHRTSRGTFQPWVWVVLQQRAAQQPWHSQRLFGWGNTPKPLPPAKGGPRAERFVKPSKLGGGTQGLRVVPGDPILSHRKPRQFHLGQFGGANKLVDKLQLKGRIGLGGGRKRACRHGRGRARRRGGETQASRQDDDDDDKHDYGKQRLGRKRLSGRGTS